MFFSLMLVHIVLSKRPQTILIFLNPFFIFLFSLCDFHYLSIALGFPCGSAGNKSACNVGDLDSIPGLGRCPGEGKGYSLQYSGPEDSVDCVVHGVTKSLTQQSDCSLIKVM